MTHYGRRQGIRNKIYLERNEKQVKFLIGTFFFGRINHNYFAAMLETSWALGSDSSKFRSRPAIFWLCDKTSRSVFMVH